MSRTITGLLFAFFLNLAFGKATSAQTIMSASCGSPDVQAALNSVTADGAIVIIPSGTCNWTTTVTYNQAHSTTIIGHSGIAGTCAPGGSCTASDATIIVDSLSRGASCASPDDPALSINTASGKWFRLTGITFQFTGNQTCGGSIRIGGNSQLIRVDHNHFYHQYSTGVGMGGWTYGVFDHNLFEAIALGTWNAIKFEEGSWNGDSLGLGDQSWAAATNPGGSGAVYVENNEFFSASAGPNYYADDCTSGGRFVWRYNLMLNASLQTHATGAGLRHRGCRSTEIYNNSFSGTGDAGGNFNAFFLSSGTSLIWGNTIDSTYSNFVTVHTNRRDNSTYAQTPPPNGWGYCGTSQSGTGSAWDQNSNVSTGYTCLDQPGQGVGQLLVNDFPNTENNITGTVSWPNEALEPVYEWLNTSSTTTFLANYESDALIANADYYLHAESFTGSAGTGSGLLSARPSTCTPKVAYWGTDTATLYQCTSTDTWTAYYTPFMYPHPLTQILTSGTSPAAPTNLRVVVN